MVEKDEIIKGDKAKPGDVLLGLASSGIHSNGYSLVRNVCFKKAGLEITDTIDELGGRTLGEALLEPTRIYVRPVVKVLEDFKAQQPVHAMAHITGGGLVGNIPRVLPNDCDAVLDKSSWPVLDVFKFLQNTGPVEEHEMFRVFNMGIGFVMAVEAEYADAIIANIQASGEKVYKIGTIEKGSKKVVLR